MAKLKEITEEDLNRWRSASADKELADNSFPGMSVEEGKRAILTYYRTLNDLLKTYDINTEESAMYISPVDGGIYALENYKMD